MDINIVLYGDEITGKISVKVQPHSIKYITGTPVFFIDYKIWEDDLIIIGEIDINIECTDENNQYRTNFESIFIEKSLAIIGKNIFFIEDFVNCMIEKNIDWDFLTIDVNVEFEEDISPENLIIGLPPHNELYLYQRYNATESVNGWSFYEDYFLYNTSNGKFEIWTAIFESKVDNEQQLQKVKYKREVAPEKAHLLREYAMEKK